MTHTKMKLMMSAVLFFSNFGKFMNLRGAIHRHTYLLITAIYEANKTKESHLPELETPTFGTGCTTQQPIISDR